jgi:DNA-binding response OmpR family regulator
MLKILIVEDGDEAAKIVTKKLSKIDFGIIHVNDGITATETALRDKPNLIVLDLTLPGGGGLTFLKRIKMSKYTKNIPVVVITGVKDPDLEIKVVSKGVSAYLEKPYDPDVLFKTIEFLLLHSN